MGKYLKNDFMHNEVTYCLTEYCKSDGGKD